MWIFAIFSIKNRKFIHKLDNAPTKSDKRCSKMTFSTFIIQHKTAMMAIYKNFKKFDLKNPLKDCNFAQISSH